MPPQDFHDPSLMAHVKRLWVHGFLAGLGVVLIFLAGWYFLFGWPQGNHPEGQEEAKAAMAQTPAPPAAPSARATPAGPGSAALPPAALKAELEGVLARLAEAHRHKDLSQLLSLYDPTFPELQQKAEEISRSWKVYDYLGLRFRLEGLRSPSPGRASARIVWEAETRNCGSHEIRRITRTYQALFSNDSGQWRIKSLEKTGQAAEQKRS